VEGDIRRSRMDEIGRQSIPTPPQLPFELWALIFRLAVQPDLGLVDTSPLLPLHHGRRSWNENKYLTLQSHTKKAQTKLPARLLAVE
jgi:hypothetical protein